MRNCGFSLIAMSIILTVASLVFVSFLPGREAGDQSQKMINNEQKLEKVEEAMRSFMTFNGRRPCPADGSSAPGSATFGAEAGVPNVCGTAPLGPDAGTGHIVGGTIPTKALGLDASYAFDEWGRRFTYVVDTRATQRSTCIGLEGVSLTTPTPTGTGGLKIENTNGGTVLDNVMYAYISHGPSGYGAFPAQGAATPAKRINTGSTDTDEQVNAGVGSTFNYSTSNFTNVKVKKPRVAPASGDTGFDDLVWYRPDIKNTCCLGPICIPKGFRIDGDTVNGNIGGQTGGTYGTGSIAFADINGDGIPDLLILGTTGQYGPYNLYVVFGQANRSSFPNPFLLSSLNGINGFELTNITPWTPNLLIGDLNGDGIQDVVIYEGTSDGQENGYIIFGQSGGTWPSTPTDINTLNNTTTPQVTILPDCGGWNHCQAAIGDINGDGINDLLIFAGDSTTDYVYFGHPTQAAITAGTYPNGPPTVWPSSVTTAELTGGTAKGGAYGFVQQAASTSHTASTNPVTFTSNTNAGDLIMVAFDYPTSATFSSIADSQGNSFTQVGSTLTKGSNASRVYYAKNIAGGADTVTLTFTGSTTSDIYITEYSGMSTATALDVQKGKTGNAGAISASATTTVQGDIIYGFCFDTGGNCTAGTGFTAHTVSGNLVEDMTSGAAGSYAATATAANAYTMQMAALEPAAGMVPSYGFTISGAFGDPVVGDFNHDGIQDILASSGGAKALVLWGQSPSFVWPATVNTNSTNASWPANGSAGVIIKCSGYAGWAWQGQCTLGNGAAGDFNNDGITDFMLSGPSVNYPNNAVFVFYGSAGAGATTWWPSNWNSGTATNSMTFSGSFASGAGTFIDLDYNVGATGLTMADISGDSKQDLIMQGNNGCVIGGQYVGCDMNYTAIFNNAPAGATYWSYSHLNGTNGFLMQLNETPAASYDSGPVVSDLNHDGVNDLVFGNGSFSPNSVSNAGSTFIVWGKSNSSPYSIGNAYPNSGLFDDSSAYQGTAWTRLDGDYANEYAGEFVTTGDIDHDGNTDIAIAAPGNTPSSNNVSGAGSVYVIFGTNSSGWSSLVSGGAATLENVISR